MILEATFKTIPTRLRGAVCALGFLISLAALPAFGQQIHQLSYNGSSWTDQNLGGTVPQLGVSAFFTTPNDQFHVFYTSGYNELSQLFYNGSNWSDISLIPGDFNACNVCSMSGFPVANYQYVFYADTNGEDIHQMVYNNAEWVDTDLTAASGTDVAGGGPGNIVALTTSPALHVYYTASDTHVHQLFATNGTNWQDQDLTTLTDGPGDNSISGMAAFNIGNFQYVYYLAPNNHLHQLFYNNSSWTDEDLTVLTKTPPADAFCTLSAFVVPGTKTIRVYFVSSSNDHIIQLAASNKGKWTSTDLTKKTKGVAPSNQVVAFPSAIGGTANVYYVAGGHVNRIYQPTATTWANEDLTNLTNGGVADFYDQISGFSLQNNQYLYYVGD